jgi:hypothetical protein
MPRLVLDLHADELAALQRAALDRHDTEIEAVAALLLRDALIAGGWLEDGYGLDEDTETVGEA